LVIGIGLYSSSFANPDTYVTPIVSGILEGYQTFDAIGAVVVGGVIIISINFKNTASFEHKRQLIRKSGLIAGLGLFIIYAGLISVGAYYGSEINIDNSLSSDMQRANLLRGISLSALGTFGNTVLSILISLACFTTAVGIIAGTADYFKGLFSNSQKAYIITAAIASAFGVLIGQLDFSTIIHIALPILMFIYPITIVLILLNIMPERLASKTVFRGVVLVTFIFSIPDFLGFLVPEENIQFIVDIIPLGQYTLGWALPALIAFLAINASNAFNKASN
jgi:LIVCS family branched-chain amino acid:cation transporter